MYSLVLLCAFCTLNPITTRHWNQMDHFLNPCYVLHVYAQCSERFLQTYTNGFTHLFLQMVCNGTGSLGHRHPHRPTGHQRLELLGSGAQEMVPVPHKHAPRTDQSDQRWWRKPAGRSYHLVYCYFSSNTAAKLASRVCTTGDPPETRGDRICAW